MGNGMVNGYGMGNNYNMGHDSFMGNGYGYSNGLFLGNFMGFLFQFLFVVLIIFLLIAAFVWVKNYIISEQYRSNLYHSNYQNNLFVQTKTCKGCGHHLNNDWKVCPYCGKDVGNQ